MYQIVKDFMSTSRKPAKASRKTRKLPLTLGWREWVSLPDLGLPGVKAKIDSGARTSALHATEIQYIQKRGVRWVRFTVHPLQRKSQPSVRCEAKVIEVRHVKSSVGHSTERPVIETTMVIDGRSETIELTLINRDVMGFRMLVGRQAIRNQYLIDPGHSYYFGKKTNREIGLAMKNEV